jgi:hypothetical protein
MGLPFWGRSLRPGHGFEGPLYATNPHDVVQLGDEKLPGTCSVEALPEHVYDRQKVEGRDGATLVLRGYLPGPIDIEWTLWTEEQWEKAQEVIAKIWRKPGKLAPSEGGSKKTAAAAAEATVVEERALDIRHPGLQLLGVQRVVIRGISPPKRGPVPQSRVINIKCLEYVPTPKKKQKPTKVAGSASKLAPVASFLQPKNGLGPSPSATDAKPFGPAPPPQKGPH